MKKVITFSNSVNVFGKSVVLEGLSGNNVVDNNDNSAVTNRTVTVSIGLQTREPLRRFFFAVV